MKFVVPPAAEMFGLVGVLTSLKGAPTPVSQITFLQSLGIV